MFHVPSWLVTAYDQYIPPTAFFMLSSTFQYFLSVSGYHPETLLYLSFFVRLGILWSCLAFLESVYSLTLYHVNKFELKSFKIKDNLFTSVGLGEAWSLLPASPIKMGAIVSGLKNVSTASGLPHHKQRRWYLGDWDLVQGRVYVCKDLNLND